MKVRYRSLLTKLILILYTPIIVTLKLSCQPLIDSTSTPQSSLGWDGKRMIQDDILVKRTELFDIIDCKLTFVKLPLS
jgi:hypothetical protein